MRNRFSRWILAGIVAGIAKTNILYNVVLGAVRDLPKPYPSGPINFNAWFGLTWRHAFCLWSDPLAFIEGIARNYGDLVFYRLFWHKAYQVNHPDLIREVLVTKAKTFQKEPRQMGFLRELTGDGIITTEGESWVGRRRMLLPAFQSRYAERMAAVAVDETERMLAAWSGQSEVHVHKEFTNLMLRVSGRAMFGMEIREEVSKLGEAFGTLSGAVTTEITWPWNLPVCIPTPHNLRKRRARETIQRLVDVEIARRRTTGNRGDDLLSRLLAASDGESDAKGLTDEQLRNEAFTMFFAAHHTVAANLAWTLYLLSQNPEQQRQIVAEIDTLLQGRSPTNSDVQRMPYTEMVLKESMRIYPPAWTLFARQAATDVELDGFKVPIGSWVFIYPWVVHRDARFFPDPLKFDPLRFSPEREKRLPVGAYIPFGLGPHMCPGSRIGMLVLQHILPIVLQHFTMQFAGHRCRPRPEPMISIRPRNDICMRPIARNMTMSLSTTSTVNADVEQR